MFCVMRVCYANTQQSYIACIQLLRALFRIYQFPFFKLFWRWFLLFSFSYTQIFNMNSHAGVSLHSGVYTLKTNDYHNRAINCRYRVSDKFRYTFLFSLYRTVGKVIYGLKIMCTLQVISSLLHTAKATSMVILYFGKACGTYSFFFFFFFITPTT